MRLELTACKEIIRNRFNMDDQYNNSRNRLNNHILVLSDELLQLWEQDAQENRYHLQFQNWYFSLIGSAKRLRKVTLKHGWQGEDGEDREAYIVGETARGSKDGIVVGDIPSRLTKNYRDLYFISSSILNRDKSHTIEVGDIKDVRGGAILDHFFDIVETPIRIQVRMGDDARLLADYLSQFYRDSKHITIKDTYLHKNEYNLRHYVMEYIPKTTEITFRVFWNQRIKDQLTQHFTNYMGYPTLVVIENKKLLSPLLHRIRSLHHRLGLSPKSLWG